MILAAVGEGWLGILVSAVPVLIGGGIVQGIILVIKHKPELKALDRTSAAALLDQQGQLADRLAAALKEAETKAFARITALEGDLNIANAERQRMATQLGTVSADLSTTQMQLEALQRQLAGLYRAGQAPHE